MNEGAIVRRLEQVAQPTAPARRAFNLSRLGYALGGILLFILALEILKQGARGLLPLLSALAFGGAVNSLGFGWLTAYGVLSGSPVAAMSLSLLAGGVLSDLEAFTMINGSRLGASFIVLFVGFVYYLRGRRSPDGIYIGVTALLVTFTIYLPSMLLGGLALHQGWLDGVRFGSPAQLVSFIDAIYDPITSRLASHLPELVLFAIGVVVLFGSFQVFDRALPNLEAGEGRWERLVNLFHRRWTMFGLGLAVTSVTMSVSISLTLLVPLSLKGYIRRQNIIPYVMGANITTFVDTLFASLLVNSPQAFTIVLVEMLAVSFVSVVVLVFLYRPYQGMIAGLAHWAVGSRLRLAAFLLAILAVPAVLFLV